MERGAHLGLVSGRDGIARGFDEGRTTCSEAFQLIGRVGFDRRAGRGEKVGAVSRCKSRTILVQVPD